MNELVIPLKGNHIRKVTVKGGSSSAYNNVMRNASELVLEKDWYNSLEWKFCCIRPKELGAGFKTDWIVYYVNMELFYQKMKKKKMCFTEWFNILRIK